jgi:large subunit ribosomal protein L21
MFAIVSINGKQLKVTEGQEIYVDKLDVQEGDKVSFSDVLLISDNDKTTVGTPFIKKAVVDATVVNHDREEKIVVFKKKRRKGYRVKNGHKQPITKIKVDSITK